MSGLIAKRQIVEVAGAVMELASELGDAGALERVRAHIEQYRLGLFRVVVVGEIKKGKSSFINALLGEPQLLPTASDVATSIVYKLIYGDTRRFTVFPLPGEAEAAAPPPPIDIAPEQLAEYGTEAGNPNNAKRVDFIGIQLPHPLLKEGIAIVDTPGLGGLFRKHCDITWRYVPNADAVFFVLDSVESVISQAEAEMLLRLRERNPLICFVQTKIDLVEEAQWTAWRDRNLAILSEKLGVPAERIPYFPVSARLKQVADATSSTKHLERSGYPALLDFLRHRLLAMKDDRLGRRVLSMLSVEATSMQRKLDDTLRILATETKEALEALEQRYRETRAEYERWRATHYQAAVSAFQEQAGEIARRVRGLLLERLDPSPTNPLIAELVQELRNSDCDPRAVNDHADALLGACTDRCAQIVLEVLQQYQREMQQAVQELASAIGRNLPVQLQAPVFEATKVQIGSLGMHFSGFEEARNALYGGMAGATMAGIGFGLLGLAFSPIAAVAALVAALVGGVKASDSLKQRRKEEAITKLQGLLVDTVRRVQGQALRHWDDISGSHQKGVHNALQQAMRDVEQEFADKLRAIEERRQQSREASQAKAGPARRSLERVQGVLRQIAQLAPPDGGQGG